MRTSWRMQSRALSQEIREFWTSRGTFNFLVCCHGTDPRLGR